MSFTGPVHTTTNPAVIGATNPTDPFILYPDFPNTNAILQVGRKSTYTGTTLGSTTKVYHGSLFDIQALSDFCVNHWFDYQTEELQNQVYRITITVPYDEIAWQDFKAPENVRWEFVPNNVARSIFDKGIYFDWSTVSNPPAGINPLARNTVPTVVQAAIMLAVKQNGTVKLGNDPKYAAWQPLAEYYYSLIKASIPSMNDHTITAKRMAVYNILDQNAIDTDPSIRFATENNDLSLVLSSSDLINTFEMPFQYQSSVIPSYKRLKTISGIDPVQIWAYGGYLVKAPVREFLTTTKCQLTQEFVFDEWVFGPYDIWSFPSDFPIKS